jgi:hypothetical protein
VSAEQQPDDRDTDDLEADTEDVVDESADPTEPELSSPRKPHKVRMPSKVEILKAVDSVSTESLDVDEVTREAARVPKVEDVD